MALLLLLYRSLSRPRVVHILIFATPFRAESLVFWDQFMVLSLSTVSSSLPRRLSTYWLKSSITAFPLPCDLSFVISIRVIVLSLMPYAVRLFKSDKSGRVKLKAVALMFAADVGHHPPGHQVVADHRLSHQSLIAVETHTLLGSIHLHPHNRVAQVSSSHSASFAPTRLRSIPFSIRVLHLASKVLEGNGVG